MNIEQAIKQEKFQSLDQKVTVNLLYTASWLGAIQNRFFKSFGLSAQQYNVLRILRGQKGQAASLNLVQERMLDRSSNASRLVDKLVDKALVERTMCPQDRRQVELLVTQRGLDLLSEIDDKMRQEPGFDNALTDAEKETLSTLLDKFRTQ